MNGCKTVDGGAPAETALDGSLLSMKQLPLAISPPLRPTLDNFVVGGNAGALHHLLNLPLVPRPQANGDGLPTPAGADGLLAQTGGPAVPPPPVYLWGPPGCGKTHLLHGLAARVAQAGFPVGWFDARDALPWSLQPDWALVVIDDCESMDAAAQHAAFVLFTEALTHAVPLAAAGSLPPADLALRDDLRTRLAWGHVFALQPLSEAETCSAMVAEARRRGFDLPLEVSNYLLSRFPRDLGTLMALLAALDDHGLATGRRLTVPLVRDLITHRR